MKNCTIIGLSDSRRQWFSPEITELISRGRVFSGGKRHHEIMGDYLPEDCVWIDITVPLSDVFRQYEAYEDIVIFASGDPLFYGFANTVKRECPECSIKVYPYFNSLQMLAHRMQLPYHDMHVVSLTGRPWDRFDEALINGYPLIGILTDKKKTPAEIMNYMLSYGYDNYSVTIGENLGNEDSERVSSFPSPMENATEEFATPNCIILQRTSERPRLFGIPDASFHLLNGRTKMITKMPIRLLSLAILKLHDKRSFWDVGFCTGSVSIEAKLQFPQLRITSFEVREEGRELISNNCKRFGTPGILPVIGDFNTLDLPSILPPERFHPDAVFIGGHGGKLKDMIAKIKDYLAPGGVIVFNSVSEESRQMFIEGIEAVGMSLKESHTIALDDHNPITILKAL